MTTIKLTAANIDLIRFDGEVVEIYDHTHTPYCHRLHITLLEVFQVTTDRKGHSKVSVKGVRGINFLTEMDIDDANVEKVQKLVADVNNAKATFKFD